jgi:O-antigen ligase
MSSNLNNTYKSSLLLNERFSFYHFLFTIFLVVSLVGYIPFSNRSILTIAEGSGSGSIIRQFLFILMFFLSIFFFSFNKKRIAIIALPWPILIVFFWSALSLAWSLAPSIGLRRLILTFIVTATIYNLVISIRVEKSFKIITFVLIGCSLVSLLAGIAIPDAIHQPSDREVAVIGDWRGIFVHKNNAGLIVALAFMLAFIQFVTSKKIVWGVLSLLIFIMLLLTGSKTSLILCCPALTMGYFVKYYISSQQRSLRSLLMAAIGLIVLLVFSFVLLNLQEAQNVLSDPTAFTGRVGIWGVMANVISDNPLFGHGFGTLFSVGNSSPLANYTTDYSVEWVFGISHAHSGYIEMIASIGFIGLFLCLYAFVIKPLKIFFSTPIEHTGPYIVPIISLLFFIILHNTFETSLFNGSRQGWIIWFFTISFMYCFNLQVKAIHRN